MKEAIIRKMFNWNKSMLNTIVDSRGKQTYINRFNEEFINMYCKTRGISSDSKEVRDVLNLFYTCNNGDEFINRFKTIIGE